MLLEQAKRSRWRKKCFYPTCFFEGLNPNDEDFYKRLAIQFDLDSVSFTKRMQGNEAKQLARYDFALAKQLRAEAFPRLYLQTSASYFHLISKGYSSYDEIVNIIEKIEAG